MAETGNELGSCIRRWRSRVAPSSVGLPANGPRRTSGLRREELAALAGVSVDYLHRLEQGRATNPSVEVLASLTRALQLTEEERDYLFRLARRAPPGPRQLAEMLTPGVCRLIGRLDDVAVGVFDAAWNLLTWNRTWAALMGDPSLLATWAYPAGPRSGKNDGHTRDFYMTSVSERRAAVVRHRPGQDARLQAVPRL